MNQVTALAACLQELFGPLADFLAVWVGFVRRRRALTGSAVARALVFRWMADPEATLEDIASDLVKNLATIFVGMILPIVAGFFARKN